MSFGTVLTIVGILVSLAVGLGTYYLSARGVRRSRWQSAKDTVLRDLSKTLGEGKVPTPPVILATIRSVLRAQNASDMTAVTLDEVTDDLIRQITSDPFLDADRRNQLQAEVLAIKAELKKEEARTPEQKPAQRPRGPTWVEAVSFLLAIGTTVVAGSAAYFTVSRVVPPREVRLPTVRLEGTVHLDESDLKNSTADIRVRAFGEGRVRLTQLVMVIKGPRALLEINYRLKEPLEVEEGKDVVISSPEFQSRLGQALHGTFRFELGVEDIRSISVQARYTDPSGQIAVQSEPYDLRLVKKGALYLENLPPAA